MSDALDKLLDLLDLEQIEVNIFRGRSARTRRVQRVFGGQVAGQALVAAGRTVPDDRPVHSLHAYFIRPGDPAVPLVYTVDRVRDGRSFTTRRVTAVQHGKAIFTLSASFHHPEPGLEHADADAGRARRRRRCGRNAERIAEALGQAAARAFPGQPDRPALGRARSASRRTATRRCVRRQQPGLAAGERRAARRPAAARVPDDLRL